MLILNKNILTIGGNRLEGGPLTPPEPPGPGPDPYNPLGLPPNTVRVRTNNNQPPEKESDTSFETATLVEGTTDVYDVYKSGTDFSNLLHWSLNVVEVLGANTTGVTNMNYMFGYVPITYIPLFDTSSVTDARNMFRSCESLVTVPLFDTSSVITIGAMFYYCIRLTSVPLFNTSNVTSMSSMFRGCYELTSIPLFNTSNVTNMNYFAASCSKVQSGALALYQQASSQTTPPSDHKRAFGECGKDTVTGAAELAQIPSDWGGTGA